MNITLDDQTAQRIQREIDLGHYAEPAEVIDHALNLLQAEEEWLASKRTALEARLRESIAQFERGEGILDVDLPQALAAMREARLARL